MNSKKIILLIVEGKTEELALGPILRNLITDKRTHFKVVNSDITADKNTTVKNIGYKLTRLVKAFLGQDLYQAILRRLFILPIQTGLLLLMTRF